MAASGQVCPLRTICRREIIGGEDIHLSCAICEERREKRFCPAVHGKICPQCCGEQREITLECPGDCTYLLQARQQAQEHVQREGRGGYVDRDRMALFSELEIPEVEISDQFLYEREELIIGLTFALAKSARADRALLDRDLLAAVSTLAKRYSTMVNSSIIYEPATTNVAHHAVAREIESMVREFRDAEQQHAGQIRLRDSDVLRALVFLVRLGVTRTSGRPKSRAFIDFLFAQFPERQSGVIGADEAAGRIVIP
jgi:hypothetical protein